MCATTTNIGDCCCGRRGLSCVIKTPHIWAAGLHRVVICFARRKSAGSITPAVHHWDYCFIVLYVQSTDNYKLNRNYIKIHTANLKSVLVTQLVC